MKTFHVSRHIPAAPDRVWAVLTNASRLASGPLGITKLAGTIAVGEKLKLWTEATGTRAFALTVKTFEPSQRMVWQGGLPLGLFTGTRTFTLAPKDGGVQFEMTETFSGLMSGLIEKSIPDLGPSFEKFATGLAALSQEK